MGDYDAFLESKDLRVPAHGFEPDAALLPPSLFPFQRHIVEWAVRRGRAAIFAECGTGKTVCQLAWAAQVAQHTGGRVLIFAPLAVAGQTVREGQRVGIPVHYARNPEEAGDARILITNYERLDAWDVPSFAGVVLDESSIVKSYMGAIKRALVERCADARRRLRHRFILRNCRTDCASTT